MAIPLSALEKGTALAKGASCYGVPLEQMTREELMAVAALGWKAYMDSLESGLRFVRTQREIAALGMV